MASNFVTVEHVMQTNVHLISGLASITDGIKAMAQHNVSSLVIDRRHEGDEFGLVTVTEIASRAIALNRSLDRTSIYEVMDKPTLTLDPKMQVKYAIRLLSQLGQRRALVSGDNGLLGVATLRDLVLSYAGTDSEAIE